MFQYRRCRWKQVRVLVVLATYYEVESRFCYRQFGANQYVSLQNVLYGTNLKASGSTGRQQPDRILSDCIFRNLSCHQRSLGEKQGKPLAGLSQLAKASASHDGVGKLP